MRRGEVLGLRWSDVDLAAGNLSVEQTLTAPNRRLVLGPPKTAKSRRRIALDPRSIDALRRLNLDPPFRWVGVASTRKAS